MVIFLASPSRESRNSEMESRINSPNQHLIWRSSGIVNGIQRSEMLLLLPSLLGSAYSNLAINDLPTILCTISSDLIRIFSAASSHNAHLFHTFCTHAIFTVVLAINDKYTSMCCLLNICQHPFLWQTNRIDRSLLWNRPGLGICFWEYQIWLVQLPLE